MRVNNMKECLSYDDVLLVPQYSDIKSRKEVDISCKLGKFEFKTPLIASPMNTITEGEMAETMAQLGGLGIVHRYCTIEDQVKMVGEVVSGVKAAAIGITGDYLERAEELVKNGGVEILCLDVAHGHYSVMGRALGEVRKLVGDVYLMASTIATLDACLDLKEWGADGVRVGVGSGSICQTRVVTGHGIPTLQSLLDINNNHLLKDPLPDIIADGGHKNSGDMVKALAAGANMVIAGSLFAGTRQTPGEISYGPNGEQFKSYAGMASRESNAKRGVKVTAPEGVAMKVRYKGDVREVMEVLNDGIRSGLSYSGARNIQEFENKAEFVKQTHAGVIESSPHILRK